jgi:hypothetical protein
MYNCYGLVIHVISFITMLNNTNHSHEAAAEFVCCSHTVVKHSGSPLKVDFQLSEANKKTYIGVTLYWQQQPQ